MKLTLHSLMQLVLALFLFLQIIPAIAVSYSPATEEINPLTFGAVGDGVYDDTVPLQKAFKVCSVRGLICRLPKGKSFLVTKPIFLWGKANLVGNGVDTEIIFNVKRGTYLLNLGISGKNKLENVFSGSISKVNFKVVGGTGGRILYFWRTQNASVSDNVFNVGKYAYSATSSGNDNRWVKNGPKNLIRKNIIIERNKIYAKVDNIGSEGIGLGNFDGAMIRDNTIIGVGDDPIGVHFSNNIHIINNVMESVDGRLFVVNSKNVQIIGNKHRRIASLLDGKFYRGISLLYVGFENVNIKHKFSAPTNVDIYNNILTYLPGSVDAGAAIYLYAPRDINVDSNVIINDSKLVKASAIHVLPKKFSARWTDPDRIDTHKMARVWNLIVKNNSSIGLYPQRIIMTGNCIDYMGKVTFKNNKASGYQLYCPNVISYQNTEIN